MSRKKSKNDTPAREGDVLGLSDANPNVNLPEATHDHGGHPKGIEVGPAAHLGTPLDETNTEGGATGIDMGGAGEGTQIHSNR